MRVCEREGEGPRAVSICGGGTQPFSLLAGSMWLGPAGVNQLRVVQVRACVLQCHTPSTCTAQWLSLVCVTPWISCCLFSYCAHAIGALSCQPAGL